MYNQYNFYNLKASFQKYLLAGNKKVTVKNYLSDFRHFLGWLILKFNVQNQNLKPEENLSDFFNLINSDLINKYKIYLIENKIPLKTVNRRLSTLRKFCSFCITQGWMKENPGKQVQNLKLNPSLRGQNQNSTLKTRELLNQFEKDLIKEKNNQSTINSYLNDVQEFLSV